LGDSIEALQSAYLSAQYITLHGDQFKFISAQMAS